MQLPKVQTKVFPASILAPAEPRQKIWETDVGLVGLVDFGNFPIWVFPKIMGKPPNHLMFHRVFHYFHNPFWGITIFGNRHIDTVYVVVSTIFYFSPLGK